MEGFEKIELDSSSADKENPPSSQEKINSKPYKPSRLRFLKGKKFLAGVGIFFMVVLIGIIVPSTLTLISAKNTYTQAKVTADTLKKQDIVAGSKELKKTREELKKTQSSLNLLVLLRVVPFANTYYSDAVHMVQAGIYATDAGEIFISAIEPHADVLGLKGEGSYVGGSAQDRIQKTVQAMDKVTSNIDEVAEKLKLVQKEVDYVDPNDYPKFLAGGKIRESVEKLRDLTDQGVVFIDEARPLIKVLPQLLGEPDEKKYLILFQNDKELRPTGGFMTAYSIFKIDSGIIHVDISDDIYNLDATLSNKLAAPPPIKKYLPEVPRFNLRDSNLSPDFEESMKTFSEMYEDSGGYREVNGIIAVDTQALVAVMTILGDIQVGGVTYSTKEDARCKCPQVIFALEEYADRPVNFVRGDRKGLIGDLMYEIMNKAFSSEPSVYWGPLFQTMLMEVSEKHVLFYLYDKDAQAGIKALNAGGKIMPWEGDYLHINETNFGGAKSNLYVKEQIKQEYEIKNDGTVEKKLTITYKNPFPPSDCNLERGGLCLNATLRDWFRIYVPKGSELISIKGSQVKEKPYDELGKTVFEGFLEVRPLGSKTLTITYKLPFKVAKGSPLPVLIQKQPGIEGFEHEIIVNGKQIDKFPLLTDKKLEIKI